MGSVLIPHMMWILRNLEAEESGETRKRVEGHSSFLIFCCNMFTIGIRDFNSACKRCNFMKSDAIICDAGAKSTNSPVEVMQNAAKIS